MVIFGEKAKIKKSRIKNSQIWSAKADSSDYGHSLTQDSGLRIWMSKLWKDFLNKLLTFLTLNYARMLIPNQPTLCCEEEKQRLPRVVCVPYM